MTVPRPETPVAAAPLEAETLLIPSRVHAAHLGRPYNLVATFYAARRTDRAAPLVVFNHRSTGNGAISPHLVLRHEIQARYFLSRGFAVLSPMRRGRGASEGGYVEWYDRDPLKLAEGLRHALDDLDAAVAFMRQRADIDGRRILVAGQSRGGMLSVVYAGQQTGGGDGGIVGSINFAGGWIDVDGMRDDFTRDILMRLGAAGAAPSLWLYAENDSIVPPAAARRWRDAYDAAGGQAQFYLFPPLADGADGHLLCDRPALWESAVDAFLHQLGFSW